MKTKVTATLLIAALSLIAAVSAAAAPEAGPCVPGGGYNPACDADQNGQINIADIQLTAGHWNQNGTFTSDNNHNHLGQTWTGTGSPLVLEGTWGVPYYAPLILSNTHGSGIRVGSAAHNGLQVDSAGQDGVFVCRSGSAGSCTPSSYNNGVEVGNAQANGLQVSLAGQAGLRVDSAGTNGVYVGSTGGSALLVGSTGGSGLNVGSATLKGVMVDSAGQDGVFVCRAGSPGSCTAHASNNGFEIGAAEANGMYVHSAGTNGVYVNSAVNGMYVQSASTYGLHVNSAVTGVRVTSASAYGFRVQSAGIDGILVEGASNYSGNFTGNIYVGGNCVGCLIAQLAVNSGDGTLQPGDIVAADGIADSPFDGAPMLVRARNATPGSALLGVVTGRAEPYESPENGTITLVPRDGQPAAAGEYVSVAIYGPVQVKAAGDVQMGQRVTAGGSGVRAMRRVEVDGVTMDEGGSSLGMALDAAQDGMVWVLVNPQ